MPRNDDNYPITIAGVLEMTPGDRDNPTWINQPITPCQVVENKTRPITKGGSMITGSLVDPDTGETIAFSCFGRKVFPPVGALITIAGQGISLGEYNGTPQLTIGQKATITTDHMPQRQAPPPRQATPAGRPPAATGKPAGASILGQTVGMALNNAGHDLRMLHEAGGIDIADDTAAGKFLWERASVYLRVSAHLEAGKLAPKPNAPQPTEEPAPDPDPEYAQADVVDEPPPPRRAPAASRPRPGPDGSVDTSGIGAENVPF